MRTVSRLCLVVAALGVVHLPLTAAETARLRFLAAAYMDDKGAPLSLPEAIACNGAGQVVVGDTGNGRLLRFAFREGKLEWQGAIAIPQISRPTRTQFTSKGEILVLDTAARRVVRLGPAGEFREVLALTGVPASSSVVPKGIAVDAADNIYVLDVFSARVLMLNAQGTFQKSLAIPSGTGFGTDLTVDSAGSVIVLDSIKRRLLAAGKDAAAFAPMGGDLSEALPSLPTSIAAAKGLLFVVAGPASNLVILGKDGVFLGRRLAAGAEEGSLGYPSQVCVSDRDEVFIADRDNNRVQAFRLVR